uniref:CCHC-type domain-containing protein n=1 Tax=Xenopus tropicalis TaxID=8364 RepID=A0A803JC22_XENTR
MDVLAKKIAKVTCSGDIVKFMQGSPDPWAMAQVYVTRAIQEKCMSKAKGKSALVFAACWIAEQYKTLAVQKENLEEKIFYLNDTIDSLKFSVENAAAISISNQQTMAENKKEIAQLKQRLRDAEGTIKRLVATSTSNVGADNSKCISEIKGLKTQLGARSPVSAVNGQNNTKKGRDLSVNESSRKCNTASEGNVASLECTSHARPSKLISNCAEYRTDKLKDNSPGKQVSNPLQSRKQHNKERVSAIQASLPAKQTWNNSDKKHTEKKLFRCYVCSKVGHIARYCTLKHYYWNDNNWYNERENWNSSRWGFQKKSRNGNTWIPYQVLKTQKERLSAENFYLQKAWGAFKKELESIQLELSQIKGRRANENRGKQNVNMP